MSDTSTPPPPPTPITDLPEEQRGRSRVWVYFLTGIALLALIIWFGSRQTQPPPAPALPETGTPR